MEVYNKEDLSKSIERIDNAVSQLNLKRKDHFILSQDITKLMKYIDFNFNKESIKKETKL